jgi:hypothetical protein
VNPDFREAEAPDVATLLAFMREFNASQGYSFEQGSARRAPVELLASPSHGKIWLIEVERGNRSARALYESLGFIGNDRRLLTHRVDRAPTRERGRRRGI